MSSAPQNQKSPLLWAGRPLTELLRQSWPIAVSMLSYSVMTLVDTLVVSGLGTAELAGVGLAGTACVSMLCFAQGLFRGTKTLIAQGIGAGRSHETTRYVGAAIVLAVILGLIASVVSWIGADLLRNILSTAESGDVAARYMRLRMLGAAAVLVFVAIREARYGWGETRTPMIAAVVGNILNIALCVFFVWGLHWGIEGAAFATVIAHCSEAAIMLIAQKADGFGLREFNRSHMLATLRLGVPTGIQFTLEVGSFLALASIIASMSEAQMAAHQIVLQLIHFAFLPPLAVSEAASVLVGQAVGAGQYPLVKTVFRKGLILTSVYALAWTLAFAVLGHSIGTAFTTDPVVLAVVTQLFFIAAVFQVFDGANLMARGTLRGAGDVVVPAWVGVATAWALTPPLAWFLGIELGWLAVGGWIGLCVEVLIGSAILVRRVERAQWKPHAERARAAQEQTTRESLVAATA